MTTSPPMDRPGLLLRGGPVYSPADPRATALLISGGIISWVGSTAAADELAGDRGIDVVELAGCLVTPAFVDAHTHATSAGVALTGLRLGTPQSAVELLDAVAAHVATLPADALVLGHGWDNSRWLDQRLPTAEQLDRAAGGRRTYLSRVDKHSALVAGGIAQQPGGSGGSSGDGSGDPRDDRVGGCWVRGDAHHAARSATFGSLRPADRRRAQRAFRGQAAALGIGAVHECAGPEISGEDDLTGLLALAAAEPGPEVYGYWGALGEVERARELGALGAGGDLFVDGSIGSHTAALREPYADAPSVGGTAYLDADRIAQHVTACVGAGSQPGFHAIGDRAIDLLLAGLAAAATAVSEPRLRAARTRLEHAELVHPEHFKALVEHGVVASVQPAFDATWGGPRGMYATALGAERALRMNPLAGFAGVGVPMAFGSDAPVTPLDPWGAVRAAAHHLTPVHRISARAAFAAHTRGGWRAIGRDTDGVLVPGAPATFAVWRLAGGSPAGGAAEAPVALPDLGSGTPAPVCVRTVVRGRTIFTDGTTGEGGSG
jgi:predicted amidohydrolase YtcJ